MEKNRAIFLDRDGVINIDHGYTYRVADFALVEGAAAAIRHANAAGYLVLVVTNQGGIGLGYYDHDDVRRFHDHMFATLAEEQAVIHDVAYCPHHPKAPDPEHRDCSCRKPSPAMLLGLAEKHDVDLGQSAMIGDRITDLEAGRAAGAQSFLFEGGRLDLLMKTVLTTIRAEESTA